MRRMNSVHERQTKPTPCAVPIRQELESVGGTTAALLEIANERRTVVSSKVRCDALPGAAPLVHSELSAQAHLDASRRAVPVPVVDTANLLEIGLIE